MKKVSKEEVLQLQKTHLILQKKQILISIFSNEKYQSFFKSKLNKKLNLNIIFEMHITILLKKDILIKIQIQKIFGI